MRAEVLTALYNRLQNDSVLTSLLGNRVFCGTALRSNPRPFIVYHLDLSTSPGQLANDGFLAIDVYDDDENLTVCEAVAARVDHLMDGWVIPNSSGIRFYNVSNNSNTDPDGSQWVALRYKVRGPDNAKHSYRMSL